MSIQSHRTVAGVGELSITEARSGARASSEIEVNVIFTDSESTLAALEMAGSLARNLGARINLVAAQSCPWYSQLPGRQSLSIIPSSASSISHTGALRDRSRLLSSCICAGTSAKRCCGRSSRSPWWSSAARLVGGPPRRANWRVSCGLSATRSSSRIRMTKRVGARNVVGGHLEATHAKRRLRAMLRKAENIGGQIRESKLSN